VEFEDSENLQQPMIEFEEFDDDVNAHKKPLPPTI
jgi:hypothetical protein